MTVIAISCNYAWASLGISKECEVLLIKKWNVWVQPELRRKIYEPLPMRGRHSQWGPAHTTDISHCKIKLDSNFWIMFFFTFRVKGVPVAEMPFSFPDITDHFLTQWEDGTGMQLATRLPSSFCELPALHQVSCLCVFLTKATRKVSLE